MKIGSDSPLIVPDEVSDSFTLTLSPIFPIPMIKLVKF